MTMLGMHFLAQYLNFKNWNCKTPRRKYKEITP